MNRGDGDDPPPEVALDVREEIVPEEGTGGGPEADLEPGHLLLQLCAHRTAPALRCLHPPPRLELSTILREASQFPENQPEKAPSRAFSLLPTSGLTIKNLLRHYAELMFLN